MILAIAFVCPYISLVAQSAQGTVYLDINKNGIREKSEVGVPGVRVSNGREVVLTNELGQYHITLAPQSTLFISKPSNLHIPLNEVNLPQFYYHHYPTGTPAIADWQYEVIKPTGPLPAAIDFALWPGQPELSFKAMGFADPQTRSHRELDMLRMDVIDALFGNPYAAKFGLVAGDIVHDNLALYERHNRLMAQIGIPIWNVPGNHDLNQNSPTRKHATQTYKNVFGPEYYSFDYGQVHFLALNNVGYQGRGRGYVGNIDSVQMTWIANDLEHIPSDRLIMIITHIPLITYANNRTFPKGTNTDNLADLIGILSRFQHVYAVAGHDTSNSWKVKINHTHNWHGYPLIAHTLAETRGSGWQSGPVDERGVRDATMADGNPNGYYIFHFDGHDVRPQFIPAGGDPTDRLRIVLDPPLVALKGDNHTLGLNRGELRDTTYVIVNFFDGGVRDSVLISLDGAPPVPMEYFESIDPTMQHLYDKYRDTPYKYPTPEVSSHIWRHRLFKLDPGLHSAKIKARDEFGFDDEETLSFEILEK